MARPTSSKERMDEIKAAIMSGMNKNQVRKQLKCGEDIVSRAVDELINEGYRFPETKANYITDDFCQKWDRYAGRIRRYYERARKNAMDGGNC